MKKFSFFLYKIYNITLKTKIIHRIWSSWISSNCYSCIIRIKDNINSNAVDLKVEATQIFNKPINFKIFIWKNVLIHRNNRFQNVYDIHVTDEDKSR